jgi:imidazolonepropionase-like amidohydrolase
MATIFLTNATVLDVATGVVSDNQSITIINTKIASVERGGHRPPRTAEQVIDVKGRVIMPGLCDAHVHVTACTPDFAALARMEQSYVTAQSAAILHDMLMRGFTTVRDAGGADHGLARAIEEKLLVGPRLLFCGKAISQTGGHGDMRLEGEHEIFQCGCRPGLGVICDGAVEVRRACRDGVRRGATHIKLMVSGGISSPTDRLDSTQLAYDEIHAAVEEAEAANIYCMAHAYSPRAIKRAVLAGVRSIEHGNYLDEEVAQVIKDRGAFLVPTLVTYDAMSREGLAAGLPPSMHAKIGDVLDAGRRALKIAINAGVTLVYGTDLLGRMHRHQLSEVGIRAESQSAIDIIRSATINAARLFNLEQSIGQVRAGMEADLLVLDGNPVDDLSVLQAPNRFLRLIMKGGVVVKNSL